MCESEWECVRVSVRDEQCRTFSADERACGRPVSLNVHWGGLIIRNNAETLWCMSVIQYNMKQCEHIFIITFLASPRLPLDHQQGMCVRQEIRKKKVLQSIFIKLRDSVSPISWQQFIFTVKDIAGVRDNVVGTPQHVIMVDWFTDFLKGLAYNLWSDFQLVKQFWI